MIKKFNNQEDLAKDLALFILTKIKRKKKFYHYSLIDPVTIPEIKRL